MADYIYVILDKQASAVKIGYSCDPVKRLSSLQTAHSTNTLTILSTFEGGKYEEYTIHEDLKNYRLQGEWFKYNKEVIHYLLEFQSNLYENQLENIPNDVKTYLRVKCNEYLDNYTTKPKVRVPMKLIRQWCLMFDITTNVKIRSIMESLNYHEVKDANKSVFFTKTGV